MNKNEFLQKLKDDLSSLSEDERMNALKYYEEYFEDAEAEEDSSDGEIILENVLHLDMEVPEAPEPPIEIEIIKEKEEEIKNINYNYSKPNNSNNNNLKIILLLCTAPFWLPLLIGLASVAFGLFMTIFGLAFAVAALAVSGFVMIGAGFMSVGYGVLHIFIDITSAFYPIGAGLVVIGLGIIMAYGFTKLTAVIFKSQFKLAGMAIRGITGKFSHRGA